MGHNYSTKAAVGLLAVSLGIMMALAAWMFNFYPSIVKFALNYYRD